MFSLIGDGQQAKTDGRVNGLLSVASHMYATAGRAAALDPRGIARAVGLIMIYLDDFKSINDLYGHQQGDIVLRHDVGDVL